MSFPEIDEAAIFSQVFSEPQEDQKTVSQKKKRKTSTPRRHPSYGGKSPQALQAMKPSSVDTEGIKLQEVERDAQAKCINKSCRREFPRARRGPLYCAQCCDMNFPHLIPRPCSNIYCGYFYMINANNLKLQYKKALNRYDIYFQAFCRDCYDSHPQQCKSKNVQITEAVNAGDRPDDAMYPVIQKAREQARTPKPISNTVYDNFAVE